MALLSLNLSKISIPSPLFLTLLFLGCFGVVNSIMIRKKAITFDQKPQPVSTGGATARAMKFAEENYIYIQDEGMNKEIPSAAVQLGVGMDKKTNKKINTHAVNKNGKNTGGNSGVKKSLLEGGVGSGVGATTRP